MLVGPLGASGRRCGGLRCAGPSPRSLIRRGSFSASLSPDQVDQLGLKPFGDGGADLEPQKPKVYTHGPCRSAGAARHILQAGAWRSSAPGSEERRTLVDRTLTALRDDGFVVLEDLLPQEDLQTLEADAARLHSETPQGFVPQPLRAARAQIHVPFEAPWVSDMLVKHDLVLDVTSKYIINNMASGRDEEDQQWHWVQWASAGSKLEWFLQPEHGPAPGPLLDTPPPGCTDVGSPDKIGPWLGRVVITKTPPLSPPQKKHRDIILPGPAAQLTIQVVLTPLEANNGPLGYVPGSHILKTPGYEVIANPPLGSIVLYDSFLEHRGIENDTPRNRYAMYYEFETRGVFGGYPDSHFGQKAESHTHAFRRHVDPPLRELFENLA